MIPLVNDVAQAWWSWMGSMLWQVSVLVLVVGAIDLLIGKWAWPQVRYALWMLVLIKLLIPPSWSLPTSVVSRAAPWAQVQIVQLLDDHPDSPTPHWSASSPGTATPIAPSPESRKLAPADDTARAGLVWQVHAMGIWMLGMALLAALLLLRMTKLRRWHREQEEKKTIPPWFHALMVQVARRIDLDRLPAIVFSEDAVTPAVYGAFRPVLLLPADYTDKLSREDAEHVLLHELAHLKRGDLWLHGLFLLLQVVYWFNPLLIWARKQTRHVRELCCDLTIANLLREKTVGYRKTLLNTTRELLTESLEPGMGLLGVFEEPFRLVARLRWLEKQTWNHRKWMITTSFLVLLIMVPFVLPMAAVDPERTGSMAREADKLRTTQDAAVPSGTELYFREETRWERYVLFLRTDFEIRSVGEFWIGDQRAAYIEDDRRVILDRTRNTLTYVNPRKRTYVETQLPLDLSTLFSDELKRQRRGKSAGASVEPTGKSREVRGYECDGYAITQWEVRDGKRGTDRKVMVWATTEVDADYTLAEELLDNLRRLLPHDERRLQELRKIRGMQLRLELEGPGGFLTSEKIIAEDVEIARKTPPPEIYDLPADYTRLEQLTLADF